MIVKWLGLVMLVITLLTKLPMIDILRIYKSGKADYITKDVLVNRMSGYFFLRDDIFMLVLVSVLLAMYFFVSERNNSSYGFTASIPVTRKESIITKFIMGSLFIFLITVSSLLVNYLIYFSNYTLLNQISYFNMFKAFLIQFMTCISVFAFFMMAQAITGNVIYGTVIGGMLMHTPVLFINGFIEILRYHNIRSSMIDRIREFGNSTLFYLWYGCTEYDSGKIEYESYSFKLILLIIISLLFFIIAVNSYIKNSLERNGHLFIFKKLEIIFKVIFAICSGMFIALIFVGEWPKFTEITLALGIIAGWFISRLMLKITGD